MEDPTAVDRAVDPTSLGFSREFSVKYGLGWVFQWVWTIFGLGFSMLILSWVFQWVCLDFELGFLIAILLILG